MKKFYGKMTYDFRRQEWVILDLQPHVVIKLKLVFQGININQKPPFVIKHSDAHILDLNWVMQRYPLRMSPSNKLEFKKLLSEAQNKEEKLDKILHNHEVHEPIQLKSELQLRPYQRQAVDLFNETNHLLVGDDVGLGKTFITIGCLLNQTRLPALIVVKPHLLHQWERAIDEHTNLRVHSIEKFDLYRLPNVDVFITKYNMLSAWQDELASLNLGMVAFDEVQELRRMESLKYQGAKKIVSTAKSILGLSATPIYNYGDEFFNIMDIIKPGCLGVTKEQFIREWTTDGRTVDDPQALGAYLYDNYLMLRRTREAVGMEEFEFRKSIENVPFDEDVVANNSDEIMKLAEKLIHGTYVEKGQAARSLDIKLRKVTGIAKARYVAQYSKFYIENGESIIITCWHRQVYDIICEELEDYNPLKYSGSETAKQKDDNVQAFRRGDSKVLLMSLRSGDGLNGLQDNCSTIIFSELDWSPAVHKQLKGRLSRDGQEEPIDVVFVVTDFGSDPIMIDKLGVKGSQSDGVIDPFSQEIVKEIGESRLKEFAQKVLENKSIK